MARKRPAPYVPLSVYYADDEAVMDVGEDAELMFLRMMAYAGRTPTTEGYVSRRVCLTRLGVDTRPEVGPESSPERRLERLAEAGLITVERDGYRLTSWLRWNRSAEEMGREREQDRNRKASLTRDDPEDVPETGPESSPEDEPDSDRVPSGSTEADKKQKKEARTAPLGAQFAEFYDAYPVKKARAEAEKAYRRQRSAGVTHERIMSGLAVYVNSLSRPGAPSPKYAQGWLNGKRWEDEDSPGATVTLLAPASGDPYAAYRWNEDPDKPA